MKTVTMGDSPLKRQLGGEGEIGGEGQFVGEIVRRRDS